MPHATPLLIAQLSDLHLFADPAQQLLGLNTSESLQTIVNAVQQLSEQPDVLLLTGDLAQDETPAAYQQLTQILAPLNIPTYWVPGNHDNPSVMGDILNQVPFSVHKTPQLGDWQLILLDSSVPHQVYGALAPECLAWLDNQLQQARPRPTLVALHHPPVPIQSRWIDQLGLRQPDDFMAVIARHPHVKLVVFGHIHQQHEQHHGGVAFMSPPSTCVQFAPRHNSFAVDDISPGFRLLRLHADGHFETEVHRVAIDQQSDLTALGY